MHHTKTTIVNLTYACSYKPRLLYHLSSCLFLAMLLANFYLKIRKKTPHVLCLWWKNKKITKQKLFLCCISRLLSIFAILYYYYYYYYYTTYTTIPIVSILCCWKMGTKNKTKNMINTFRLRKLVNEPPKSNPAVFNPAVRIISLNYLTFCKILAQSILEHTTTQLLQKFQKTKPFKKPS